MMPFTKPGTSADRNLPSGPNIVKSTIPGSNRNAEIAWQADAYARLIGSAPASTAHFPLAYRNLGRNANRIAVRRRIDRKIYLLPQYTGITNSQPALFRLNLLGLGRFCTRATDFQQLDFEDQRRPARDRWTALVSIGDIRRTD